MNSPRCLFAVSVIAGLWYLPATHAQTAAPSVTEPTEDEPVVLSPFTVDSTKDKGYRATNSISGTRLNTAIKDLPMPIEVITGEFIRDTIADVDGLQLDTRTKHAIFADNALRLFLGR